jgi:RNA polymerase sigma-70 factor (TIGR02943 family)
MDKTSSNVNELNPEMWIDQHSDFLYQYALLRLANNTQLAEDFVQETFLSALKSASKFEGKSSLRTWFVSILKNKIIDYYRKNKDNIIEQTSFRNEEFIESGAQQGQWKTEFAPADWDKNPDKIFEQKEFYNILNKCLNGLPKNLSSVFVLKELDSLETEKICKELSISSSNLWVILHRARMQLRRCLELNWFSSEK